MGGWEFVQDRGCWVRIGYESGVIGMEVRLM